MLEVNFSETYLLSTLTDDPKEQGEVNRATFLTSDEAYAMVSEHQTTKGRSLIGHGKEVLLT